MASRGRTLIPLTLLAAVAGVALVFSTSVAQDRLERVRPAAAEPAQTDSPMADPPSVAETDPTARPRSEITTEIDGLIEQLGNPEYEVREKASRRLLQIGAPALPALAAAMENGSPEVAWRAQRLYEDLRVEQPGTPRPVEPEEQPAPETHRRSLRRSRLFGDLPSEFRRLHEVHEQRMQELGRFMESFRTELRPFPSFELPGARSPADLDQLVNELFEGLERETRREQWSAGEPERDSVVIQQFSMQRTFDSQLGLELETAQPALRAQLVLEDGQGLVVNRVLEDSSAAAAGIEQYDVIVSVDGESVGSFAELQATLGRHTSGSSVTLELRRAGKKHQVGMTVR